MPPSNQQSTNFWVSFPQAESIVRTLVSVANETPNESPACVILSGPAGMGKRGILRETERRLLEQHPTPSGLGDTFYVPMLITALPSTPTAVNTNVAMLYRQRWPISAATKRIANTKVVELLHEQKTRLVAIINGDIIFSASSAVKQDAIDGFRFVMASSKCPLVISGTSKVESILDRHPDPAEKAIILRIDPWEAGAPFQQLIREMAAGLHISNPERLAEPNIAALIWKLSRGLTGETKNILKRASEIALGRGSFELTIQDIDSVATLFPSYVMRT